jgi:RNA polymerase sigma-70 factor (sigma-E family)
LRIDDREMVRLVYVASYQRLVVQLYAVTGDLAEAQEVVQDAFVQALAAPRRLRHIDNPEAWLRTVAVNLARTRSRRRRILNRVLRRVDAPPPVVPGTSPEHVALMAAVRNLPTGQRLAVALHYLADQPVDQVARTLGVSVGTVKSRLARGRAALAVLLDDPASDGPSGTRAARATAASRSASTRPRSNHV